MTIWELLVWVAMPFIYVAVLYVMMSPVLLWAWILERRDPDRGGASGGGVGRFGGGAGSFDAGDGGDGGGGC